jgi:hypothetical protein
MRNPGRLHTPASLPASLDQHLNLYALAAGAAGVSLLAFAQPSEAKIVYTPTHKVIGTNGLYLCWPVATGRFGAISTVRLNTSGRA